MAMRHPKSIVLSGALTALIVMTVSSLIFYFLLFIFSSIIALFLLPLLVVCGSDEVMHFLVL